MNVGCCWQVQALVRTEWLCIRRWRNRDAPTAHAHWLRAQGVPAQIVPVPVSPCGSHR